MTGVVGDRTKAIRWDRVVVLLIAASFTLWALVFVSRTSFIAIDGRRYFSLFDDAMISMRYAWNATHGSGLVWNPGERVEGYTNLLMVGLMALWTSLLDKSHAVLAVQLTGIPILLGIAVLSRLHWLELARGSDVRLRDGLASVAFFGSLAYYPLVYWTLTGMETGLLTLLLLTGSLLSMTYMRTKTPTPLTGAALSFSLAYLARPDSAPVAVMVLLWAAILPAGGNRRISVAWWGLVVYSIFPILQAAFRVYYYGSLVPVTYILKATGMPFAVRVDNGLVFTLPFLREARWAFLLGGAGAVLGFTRRKALLVLPPLVLTAYQVAIGGDAWTYWRLVAPGIPFLILLMLAGVDWALSTLAPKVLHSATRFRGLLGRWTQSALGRAFRLLPLPVAAILAGACLVLAGVFADSLRPGNPGFGMTQLYLVVCGSLLGLGAVAARRVPAATLLAFSTTFLLLINLNTRFLREALLVELPYKADANRNHVNASITINQFTTQAATVGMIHAGIIPYYTSRYAVDFLGKNDPYIASLPANIQGAPSWFGMSSVPGHNKYDLEYSIRQRLPTYVEGFVWGSQDLTDVFRSLYVEVSLPGPDPAFRRGDPAVRWQDIPSEKLLYP